MLRSFHKFREHPAHVLGMDKEDERAMRADAWFTEDAGALGFELGLGGVDVGDLEADVMLAAKRILLEEFHDRRIIAERLDQLDLAVGRIDEADADALRGEVERLAVRLGVEQISVELQTVLNRRRRD